MASEENIGRNAGKYMLTDGDNTPPGIQKFLGILSVLRSLSTLEESGPSDFLQAMILATAELLAHAEEPTEVFQRMVDLLRRNMILHSEQCKDSPRKLELKDFPMHADHEIADPEEAMNLAAQAIQKMSKK